VVLVFDESFSEAILDRGIWRALSVAIGSQYGVVEHLQLKYTGILSVDRMVEVKARARHVSVDILRPKCIFAILCFVVQYASDPEY
jgi:hypothetical protein